MRALLSAVLLVACAEAPPVDTAVPAGTALVYPATWRGVEAFFVDHCDACHPSEQGIDLHVVVPADLESGAGEYVVPYEPELSKLWLQVSEPSPFNDREPETYEHVRLWIEDGAPLD